MDAADHEAALEALNDPSGDPEELIELNCWCVYCPDQDSTECKYVSAQLRKTYLSEEKAVEIAMTHLQTSTKHQDDNGEQSFDEYAAQRQIEPTPGCIKTFTEKWRRREWLKGSRVPLEPSYAPAGNSRSGGKGKGKGKHGGKGGGGSSSSGWQSTEVARYQPYQQQMKPYEGNTPARAEQMKTATNFIKAHVFEKT